MILWPKACLESVVDESLKSENSDGEQHIREREEARINELRKAYLKSAFTIFNIFIFGYLTAHLINYFYEVNSQFVTTLRVAASLLIAWAVLSKLGKEIESWDGTTIPEQINALVFKASYFLGVSLVICTLFLEPIPSVIT